MKKKTILFILGGILLFSSILFFMAIKNYEPGEEKSNDSVITKLTEDLDEDFDKDKDKDLPKDCILLNDGRMACKIASDVKIKSAKITEDDFKIKNK